LQTRNVLRFFTGFLQINLENIGVTARLENFRLIVDRLDLE
jgi:hypothetical protein